jgi:5-methylcytosine-specific restriction endonuclease McrA
MPRNTVRVLHKVTCRGCGTTFRDHNRTRAYCGDFCRLLYMEARMFRCSSCGADESLDLAASLQLQASGNYDNAARRAFVVRHRPCRREMLDRHERDLGCRCRSCRAEAGLPPTRPFKKPPEGPRRSTGYRRHAPEVYARDGLLCQICGLPTEPDAHPSEDTYPSLDHEVPLGEGGTDDIENLRTAHRWCNIKRSGTPLWGPMDDDAIRHLARERFAHLLPVD